MSQADPAVALLSLSTAYWASRCLHLAADFGVADALDEEPQTADQLATKLGILPQPLHRVLRALVSHGIFGMEGDRFAHNDASRLLRSDHPASMRSLARMMGLKVHWDAYRELDHTLRTGESGFSKVSPGGVFSYFRDHPDDGQIFDEAMTGKSFAQIAGVLGNYDFTGLASIGDIGGGLGHLLHAILDATPGATGVLFDLPDVIARAATKADPRVRYVGGDFFTDALPSCDAYLLMTVLHDWSDDEATAILRNLAANAPSGARLLVVEGVVGQHGPRDFTTDLDIEMLAMTSGRERTEAEWRRLLADGGFRLDRLIPTGGWGAILEASPALAP